MNRLIITTAFLLISTIAAFPQKGTSDSGRSTPSNAAPSGSVGAQALAELAIVAHGGEKLRGMKGLVVIGSVDLNVFNQSMPATFSTTIDGDKYSFIVNSPVQPLKQVYDGRETYSSLQGFALPPITSLGFPLLRRVGDGGYVVSELPDAKKRTKGFRITTPDGYYTDFYLDDKSRQIKSFESSYEYNGRTVTTSAEIDRYSLVDGVLVPERYSQRFDLGQLTAYLSFKATQILVNPKLDEDVFQIPR